MIFSLSLLWSSIGLQAVCLHMTRVPSFLLIATRLHDVVLNSLYRYYTYKPQLCIIMHGMATSSLHLAAAHLYATWNFCHHANSLAVMNNFIAKNGPSIAYIAWLLTNVYVGSFFSSACITLWDDLNISATSLE